MSIVEAQEKLKYHYLNFITEILIKEPVSIIMYYNNYERTCGDGFYPQLLNENSKFDKAEEINFQQIIAYTKTIIDQNNLETIYPVVAWKQIDNGCINGLDGKCGSLLLAKLNTYAHKSCISQQILCANGLVIYPKYILSNL